MLVAREVKRQRRAGEQAEKAQHDRLHARLSHQVKTALKMDRLPPKGEGKMWPSSISVYKMSYDATQISNSIGTYTFDL